jgi:hypothetical protein|tara:strand:+ start:264 stop:512 length:249 start_codon:yes stop_codon:yes gene_type:complete
MRGKNSDMGLIMESMQYLLMKHYGLSMSDLKQLDEDEFEQMFAWAAAAEEIKAEEIEKATAESKSGAPVAGTSGPMPYSKGW